MTYARRRDPLYHIWKSMRARCYCRSNKRYQHYGGKGITVCHEWQDFDVFKQWSLANGYQYTSGKNSAQSMSIDRIEINGGYYPDNCRWITMQENSKMKTMSLDIANDTLENENLLITLCIGSDYS